MKKAIKKITATLSAALMCVLPFANAFSANAAVYNNQKQTFRVNLSVDSKDMNNMYELEYNLYFTGYMQNYLTFRKGRCFIGADRFRSVGLTQSRTCMTIESPVLGNLDNVRVASLTFDTDNQIIGPCSLSINHSSRVDAFNNYGEEHYIEQFYPTVNESFVLVGDADNDGEIRMNDAAIIEALSRDIDPGVEYNIDAADVDGDGQVTYYDSILVRRYLLKSINSFGDYQAK